MLVCQCRDADPLADSALDPVMTGEEREGGEPAEQQGETVRSETSADATQTVQHDLEEEQAREELECLASLLSPTPQPEVTPAIIAGKGEYSEQPYTTGPQGFVLPKDTSTPTELVANPLENLVEVVLGGKHEVHLLAVVFVTES